MEATGTSANPLDEAVMEVHALSDEQTVITTYKDIIYKTSNGAVGNTSHMLQKHGPFGRSSKYSDHLMGAGNYVNDSLTTCVMPPKFNNQQEDWKMLNRC